MLEEDTHQQITFSPPGKPNYVLINALPLMFTAFIYFLLTFNNASGATLFLESKDRHLGLVGHIYYCPKCSI